MATCFPTRPPAGTPLAEIKVFEALAKLPSPWMVFHSVGWQSYRGGRQADGETDFVALHPEFGLVLIEVKGGRISIQNGQWFSVNSRTGEKNKIKDPFKQATDAKYALLRYMDQLTPPVRSPFVCHAVALPGGSVSEHLSPTAPREIIWDGADLTRPVDAMERVLKHWSAKASLSKAQVQQIKNLIAPTTEVRRTLRMTVAESTQQLLELTDGQIRALSGLRRNRRALIYGGAGTGKTVLAIERAKSLAREGFKTLLVCYNRPLGDYLADQVANEDLITAGSFHSVCARALAAAGLDMPQRPDDQWWKESAPDLLVAAVGRENNRCGAVVVDEGQDFPQSWFDALSMILEEPDGGPFYVFADTQQAIYTVDWQAPGAWPIFDLDLNCRNTVQIAERVAAIFKTDPATLGAEGADPIFVIAEDDDDVLGTIKSVMKGLLSEEKLEPNQIVIISRNRSFIDALYETKLGSVRFQTLGKPGLVAETLYRFKGMEADVVVVDLRGVDLSTVEGKGLAYVALSRARGFLIALGSMNQAQALDWPRPSIRQMEAP